MQKIGSQAKHLQFFTYLRLAFRISFSQSQLCIQRHIIAALSHYPALPKTQLYRLGDSELAR